MNIISLLAHENNDVYQHLFGSLPISDKRSFIRTCKINSRQSVHMPLAEKNFLKMINRTRFLSNKPINLYCDLHKFTLELLFNEHYISDKYFVHENRILHQYPKIYKRLGKKEDFELISRLMKLNRDSYGGKNSDFIMMAAAKTGNFKVLEWMHHNGYVVDDSSVAFAAKGNQLETLKWLGARTTIRSSLAMAYAAKKGHMDILKYLVNAGYPIGNTPYHAAVGGYLDIVIFLYSVYPAATFGIWQGALYSDNIEIPKFLRDKQIDFNDDVFRCNNLQILIWLLDNYEIELNVNLASSIAYDGNLECLQFLYSKDCPINNACVFQGAVNGQNVRMLEWLYELNVPFDWTATNAAVSIESKVILELLISWGCPLNDATCSVAASRGNLEILELLYHCGCELNEKVIQNAAQYGHLNVVIWAHERGCKFDADCCQSAVLWDYLYVLKWLREKGCPWDERVCLVAIECGHIDILNYALENDCEFTGIAFLAAMESENDDIVECAKKFMDKVIDN
uniref:Uncharacterized protein n=1 Tax=viral metagenome TaxID=1070528 RepID=A0A6C0C9Z6_9ZZZZ